MNAVVRAETISRGFGVDTTRGLKRVLVFWLPLTLFVMITLFPFYWMLLASLKSNAELYNLRSFPFWVATPTLDHYIYLFEKTLYARWMINTLIVSIASTAISLTFGILAGYALARLRFVGAGVLGVAVFISYLVPQTLLFIPMFDVIKTLNIGDTYWALILSYPTFLIPFCTWLLMGYFKSIPKELEESALIDGSSRIGAMVRIVLPLALPGILSAGIFAFTLSWNEFIYALVFITTTPMKTVPLGVVNELIRGDVFFWGELMGGALLGSVPVALIYSLFVEHYVAGLTAGAVKG
ncbi:MAG TPA: carbohydrate ABC transporter permease [Chloroflexota bacterium]|nr:carbohydrate ABC transporter permease [Chloroflexota bacterium]